MFKNGMFGGTRQQSLRNSEKQCAACYFAYLTHFSYISFVFSFLLRSSWLLVLSCSVTSQSNSWYKTISQKTDGLVENARQNRRPWGTHREVQSFSMNGRWLVLLRHLQLRPFLACYGSVSTKLKRRKFQGLKHTSLSPLPWFRCHADPTKFRKT